MLQSSESKRQARAARIFLMFVLMLAPNQAALAEQLPVKTYTIADGLARDYINRIKQDSHGFIWFCTTEGISRFDGYGFANYGVADGLPHRLVVDFLETRDGAYLFATRGGGLVEFNPTGTNSDGSHFTSVTLGETESPSAVNRLIEDETGAIWCGTGNGLFRLARAAEGWQATWMPVATRDGDTGLEVSALAFDRQGALWIGTTTAGLYRRWPDGRVEHYTTQHGLSQNGISQLLLDRDGRMWVGTGNGLTLLVNGPRPDEQIAARVYTTKDGLFYNFISALFQSSDGQLWVGTRGGLNFLVDPKDNHGLSFRGYTTTQGLRNVKIWDITEDRDRNLWIGAESGGAMKIPHAGFTSYFEADGLGNGRISQLFSDHAGKVYVVADGVENLIPAIARFDGHAFERETPNLPPKTELTWGWNNLIVQDRKGDWWIPTAQGLYRFSDNRAFAELATAKPTRVYTVKDGMAANTVFRLFEDARGDLWFSTVDSLRAVHRWERDTDKIHIYTPQDSDMPIGAATAFANDAGGNLWLGFYTGGVCRYANGRFTQFTEKDGVPSGFVRDLFIDSKKRLWIATNSGLSRVDNPLADRPQFVNYTAQAGLASDQVTTVTEDRWGQIYVGTGRGLDRLDPDSGKIRHYTTADGLADNFINVSISDLQGVLWFGTYRGLSRFIPEPDQPLSPPPIIISGLSVAGVKQATSELGETTVTIPALSDRQNQVQIDFLSIGYAPGDVLRYQFKLEGSSIDWSAPADQRSITLANLPAGSYRFLVRAVHSDGSVSPQPASVKFTILPPFWRRGWFLGLAAMLVAAVALAIIRQRRARQREREQAERALRQEKEDRLRELEQVRRRIATDLHDDVGSSLTQISLLSEVARKKVDGQAPPVSEPLTLITRISSELVDSMSDIVWAINPAKDTLSDLSQRMRLFASDVFIARQINFRFSAPDSEHPIKVGANARRELFLIFKEGVNNMVRHAQCTEADLEFRAEADNLFLRMRDNGQGFDVTKESDGHGLMSMSERAKSMGGQCRIVSQAGSGTTLTIIIPLKQP